MNIVLIGMPGAGKSTLGVRLARELNLDFIDTDDLIRERTGKELQDIVVEKGQQGFIETEKNIITNLFVDGYVIATGGSAVYKPETMAHLKKNGVVVYLKLSLSTVKYRIHNLRSRGIAMKKGQTLADLYKQRVPLYERYADITVLGDRKQKKQMVNEIQKALTLSGKIDCK